MKLLKSILLLAITILISCSSDDSSIESIPNRTFEFNIPDLVSVRNQQNTFSVNDTIWLETTISNELIDINGNEQLLNERLGDDSELFSPLLLLKETGFEEPSIINLGDDDIVSEFGDIDLGGSNFFIRLAPEQNQSSYKSISGVVLRSEGDYFITGDFFGTDFKILAYATLTDIEINTNIIGANGDNEYHFTVE